MTNEQQKRIDAEAQSARLQTKWRREQIIADFERIAKRLEETAGEVRRYVNREDSDHAGFVEYVSWAINEIENMERNLNISGITRDLAEYNAQRRLAEFIDHSNTTVE